MNKKGAKVLVSKTRSIPSWNSLPQYITDLNQGKIC